jgi:putative transposase
MAAGVAAMADFFWLMKAQIERISRYFPLSHDVPWVDDQRVVSGIIHVIRNGLRWRDAPAAYGPQRTLYNRTLRKTSPLRR